MIETFTALLAAHLLADLLAQAYAARRPSAWPQDDVMHLVAVVALTILALGSAAPIALAAVALARFAVDRARPHLWRERPLRWLVLDKLVHLALFAALAWLLPETAREGWWGALPAPDQARWYVALAWLCGAVVAVPLGGRVIALLMDPVARRIGDDRKGLENGGLYIGWLERGLAFLFFLLGQPEGAGLLLAAKSILRFGDISKSERSHTEYVIIGTLLSFGWALVAATVTQAAIGRWR